MIENIEELTQLYADIGVNICNEDGSYRPFYDVLEDTSKIFQEYQKTGIIKSNVDSFIKIITMFD